MLWALFVGFVLLLLVYGILRIPATQTYLTTKAEILLEDQLSTKVSIGAIRLGLPKSAVVEQFYLEDQAGDTLLYLRELELDVNLRRLLNRTIKINQIKLEGLFSSIIKSPGESSFNYDFMLQSFEGKTAETTGETVAWGAELGQIVLSDWRINYESSADSIRVEGDFEELQIDLNNLNINETLHHAISCSVKELGLHFRDKDQLMTTHLGTFQLALDTLDHLS